MTQTTVPARSETLFPETGLVGSIPGNDGALDDGRRIGRGVLVPARAERPPCSP